MVVGDTLFLFFRLYAPPIKERELEEDITGHSLYMYMYSK